jgi:hypothetical protein
MLIGMLEKMHYFFIVPEKWLPYSAPKNVKKMHLSQSITSVHFKRGIHNY